MRLITYLKQKARQLKSESQVLMIAYKDKRTPVALKILIWITIGYLLSPIDLIPDFIPILGWLDDLIIVPSLIAVSLKLIPANVLTDAREQQRLFSEKYKKNNFLFAILIALIWLLILYYACVLIFPYSK